MRVKVGVSNRHVHLTKESVDILFGNNYELTKKKDLSMHGQYSCEEVVTIVGPKSLIENVRILGPVRKYNQIEVSKTDAYKLGVNPPVRDSGDVEGSYPITIIGPKGTVVLEKGCIIANRHLHTHPDDLKRLGLKENQVVSAKVGGEKGAILYNVHVKTDESFVLELHLDTDDANANLINHGDEVELIIDE